MNNGPTLLCPRCGNDPLVRHTVATGGIAYRCSQCHGTQMSLAVLRRRSDTLVPRLWAEVAANPRPGIACPLCRRPSSALIADGVELDLCRPCQSLWFDADELERFPVRRAPPKTAADYTKRQPTGRIDTETEDEGLVIIEAVDVLIRFLQYMSWH